jgi:hypothetical protein
MLYLLAGVEAGPGVVPDDKGAIARHAEALGVLHDIFVRCRVRPTYLATRAMAEDKPSAAFLAQLIAGGHCEIGAHHVPADAGRSMVAGRGNGGAVARDPATRASPSFEEELAELTDAIVAAVGRRPLSYRSGNFRLPPSHVSTLEKAGYRVDSSVAPLLAQGPRSRLASVPTAPYFLSYDDVLRAGASNVLEIPISAIVGPDLPRWLRRTWVHVPFAAAACWFLQRIGVETVVSLQPALVELERMKRLAACVRAERVPVLNVVFRSSEAMAGADRKRGNAESRLTALEGLLIHIVDDFKAVPVTFSELRALQCGTGYGGHQKGSKGTDKDVGSG